LNVYNGFNYKYDLIDFVCRTLDKFRHLNELFSDKD